MSIELESKARMPEKQEQEARALGTISSGCLCLLCKSFNLTPSGAYQPSDRAPGVGV